MHLPAHNIKTSPTGSSLGVMKMLWSLMEVMLAHHCVCAKCHCKVDHLLFCEFHLSKKQTPPAATWMDLEMTILSEASQRRHVHDIVYMWSLKYDTNELIYKPETGSQT